MWCVLTSKGYAKGNFGPFYGRVTFTDERIKAKAFVRKKDAEERLKTIIRRSKVYDDDNNHGITGEVVPFA